MKEFRMQYWTNSKRAGKSYAAAVEAVAKAVESGAQKLVIEVVYTHLSDNCSHDMVKTSVFSVCQKCEKVL